MNVQQLPRGDSTVKTAFQPKLDAFLFADYKALEVRLLAFFLHSQGDDSLALEFREGLDPHTETAKLIFPGEPTISDEQRQAGKVLTLSVQYGGGVPTIMKQLKVGREEARDLLRKFHAARPGIAALRDTIWTISEMRGYVKTLWGRQIHPESKHKALNYVIQGNGGDLMRASLIKAYDWFQPWNLSHIVSTIHDEIVFDCTKADLPFLVEALPKLMGDERIEEVVELAVDIEVSYTNMATKVPYECPDTVIH